MRNEDVGVVGNVGIVGVRKVSQVGRSCKFDIVYYGLVEFLKLNSIQ